jgi:hypothetical protein
VPGGELPRAGRTDSSGGCFAIQCSRVHKEKSARRGAERQVFDALGIVAALRIVWLDVQLKLVDAKSDN